MFVSFEVTYEQPLLKISVMFNSEKTTSDGFEIFLEQLRQQQCKMT